jgi:predicted AAA+ superfamily ATPase
VAEVAPQRCIGEVPLERWIALFSRALSASKASENTFRQLLRYGGFPEPFLEASDRMARLWRRNRVERVIREDLRDLSSIPELSRVEMLASLLPERVGSPLSRNALREDLEVSFETVTRWLAALSELYYVFSVKPYSRRVARSLKKESKLYMWDWTEVDADSPRFENLVASHLLKACDAWTDTGEGTFELCVLKNREHEEIDFLITRDGEAWLPVEVKLSDTAPSRHWGKFLNYFSTSEALQVVAKPGVWTTHRIRDSKLLVASAGEVLRYFV